MVSINSFKHNLEEETHLKTIRFDQAEKIALEKSIIPQTLFKFNGVSFEPVVVSKGLCDFFGIDSETIKKYLIEHRFINRELKNENYEDLIIKYIDHNALFMYDLEKNGKKLFFSNINYFENEEGEELALVYYTDVTALYSDNNLKSIDDFALNTDLPLILKNYCDSLTNIPNSNFFISLADKLIHELNDSGKQMAFVSFSLMDFRNFNERYGVNEGNKVLVTLASALESVFSKKRCARIEGNIFAACGDKTTIEEDVKKVFELFLNNNKDRNLLPKAGIHIYEENESVIDALDRAHFACEALMSAEKESIVWFDDGMKKVFERNQYILSNIDKALENRYIKPYYQGIVRLVNGEISEEESLARWNDPEKGSILPGDFIPVIEQSKSIYKLDLYMAERILEDLKIKEKSNIQLVPVTLNVSQNDFYMCDMPTELYNRVRKAGMPISYLIIEIQGRIEEKDFEFFRIQIAKLHSFGFKVWMNHYKGDYMSMRIYQGLNIDLIKIDVNFVLDYIKHARNPQSIRNIISIAENFGFDTLAIGIENCQQIGFLEECGCTRLQGYFYDEAIPVERIIENPVKIPRENPVEAEYYEKISRVNLFDLNLHDVLNDNSPILGDAVAVLEFHEGKYTVLRSNENYRYTIGHIFKDNPSKVFPYKIYTSDVQDIIYQKSIDRCIETGNWEYSHFLKKDYIVDAFSRMIAYNPMTNSYAIITTINSLRDEKYSNVDSFYDRNSFESSTLNELEILGLYSHMPAAMAVFQVILDNEGRKAVDARYVYVNDTYLDMCGCKSDDIIGKRFMEYYANSMDSWMTYCYRAVVLREVVHDIIFAQEIGCWLNFTIGPSVIPGCCTYVFMKIDENQKENDLIALNSATDDAIIRITKCLNGDDTYEKTMNKVLSEIGKVINPDRIYIVEKEQNHFRKTYEWRKNDSPFVSTSFDRINEKVFATFTRNLKKDSIVLIEDIDKLKQEYPQQYDYFKEHGILRFIAIPFYEHKKLMGYLCANNYEKNAILDTRKILTTVSNFIAFRILNQRLLDQLDYQSSRDELTGLLNRRSFSSALTYIANNNKSFGIFYVDANRFKYVNDTYGHDVGNKVLVEIAKRLKAASRFKVYRIGGDEFAILVDETISYAEYEQINESILSEFERPVIRNTEYNISLTVSTGYAIAPVDSDDIDKIRQIADQRMYECKKRMHDESRIDKVVF